MKNINYYPLYIGLVIYILIAFINLKFAIIIFGISILLLILYLFTINSDICIKLLFFIIPFNDIIVINFNNVDIRISEILFAILLISLVLNKKEIYNRKLFLDSDKYLYLFLASCFISTIMSTMINVSAKEFLQYIYLILVYLVIRDKVRDFRYIKEILKPMILANVIFIIASIIFVTKGVLLPKINIEVPSMKIYASSLNMINNKDARLSVFNMGAVECANYLIQSILILLYFKHNSKHNVFFNLLILIDCTLLILTFSRAGWIIFIIIFILYSRKSINIKKLLLLAMVICMLYSIPQINNRLSQIFSTSENSNKDHFILWQIALKMGSEKPVFGYGLGTFIYNVQNYQYIIQAQNAYTSSMDTHNLIFQTFAEQGFIGVALLLAFFIKYAGLAISKLKLDKENILTLTYCLFLSNILMSMTMNGFKKDSFWLILSLSSAILISTSANGFRGDKKYE